MKSIIIYFSRTGRTAKDARSWAHRIGASRLEIIPMAWRGTPKEILRYYMNTLTRKQMEIDLYKVDFDKYDRIVLMIPVICGMMSAPMRTFIRQEAGNLENVEYVIIHKGVKMRQVPHPLGGQGAGREARRCVLHLGRRGQGVQARAH